MFDPSKLHEVKSRLVRKKQNFDIRFNSENGVFTMSEDFINAHRLGVNGMKYFLGENNEIILSVQEEEDSTFYKKKEGSASKTKSFKHTVLAHELTKRDIVSGNLNITSLGVFGEAEYFQILTPTDSEVNVNLGNFDDVSDAPDEEEEDPESEDLEEIDEDIEAGAEFEDELL